MSKHTKSPWIIADKTFVYALNERGTNVFWANLQGGWIGPKADCKTSQEEIEANAVLMSAAPDLLEALEGLIDNERQSSFEYWLSIKRPSGDCDSVHSQWLESSEYEDFLDLYGDEIAVIDKARGVK